MNISKLALIALLGGALTAFGCTDDSGGGGSAGSGGSGGSGIDPVCQPVTQTCESGTSAAIVECPVDDCDLSTPPTADACDGTESLENPESCGDPTDPTISYLLTFMALDENCNSGNNLDDCDGNSCKNEALNTTSEGTDGVDNGLASIATTVVTLADVDLSGVQQAFYDSVCGQTDDPEVGTCLGSSPAASCGGRRCTGGANAGDLCTSDALCPGATCNTDDGCLHGTGMLCDSGTNEGMACTTTEDDCPLSGSGDGCVTEGTCVLDDTDCGADIAPLELVFVVDANVAAGCANVTVISTGICNVDPTDPNEAPCTSDDDCTNVGDGTCAGGGESDVILNLSAPTGDPTDPTDDAVCASGTLGTIPAVVTGVPGAFGNAVVRMTVSSGGFSNGTLSATADAATATAIAAAISPVAAQLVDGIFDINADRSGDTGTDCNAVSLTLDIGGVVEP